MTPPHLPLPCLPCPLPPLVSGLGSYSLTATPASPDPGTQPASPSDPHLPEHRAAWSSTHRSVHSTQPGHQGPSKRCVCQWAWGNAAVRATREGFPVGGGFAQGAAEPSSQQTLPLLCVPCHSGPASRWQGWRIPQQGGGRAGSEQQGS
uniref:Uncharacterized protein n=1 Tax=Rousettus aegyptiacus TaxID=9407 RepID=A0A7J8IN10_ROUAE|nr:hypothetical protein HJG63_010812 [Rousettus aegyptiacus]